MSTLVIHPKDTTTDCLSVIYEDRGWDVIRNPETPDNVVIREIKSHDRIIMLGHGTPYGLLAASGGFQFGKYIIDWRHVFYLKKKETYSIWCHSDKFFKHYGLKGFHTGMIISETSEEYYILKRVPLDVDAMAKNMELFCGTCAKYIDLSPEEAQKKILEEYVGDDEVTQYNRENILVL